MQPRPVLAARVSLVGIVFKHHFAVLAKHLLRWPTFPQSHARRDPAKVVAPCTGIDVKRRDGSFKVA
jgi:hypothetical protein